MKKKLAIFTILAACVATLLSGCDPTNLDNNGKSVRFTARLKGGPSTKTSYSGAYEAVGDVNYERIDWNDGDVITIFSPEGQGNLWSPNNVLQVPKVIPDNSWLRLVYSNYVLKANGDEDDPEKATISPDPDQPRFSNANLFNQDKNGLTWTGNTATFYGAYPAPINESGSAVTNRLVYHAYDHDNQQDLLFEIKIPGTTGTGTDVQTGDPAFVSTMPLLARKANVENGKPVTLDFYPFFSAYEFNFKSEDEETITINSLTISATTGYIWGRLFWNLSAGTDPTGDTYQIPGEQFEYGSELNPDANKTITLTKNLEISSSKDASVTLFGLPNDLSGITLTIKFTMASGAKGTATLRLRKDGNDVVFGAHKKTRLNNLYVNGNWRIFISAVSVDDWDYLDDATTTLII
ncbi:MAG: hypothetical protein IJJ72_03985 [Bacteroidales bacterium]|nr:hypothetical protein [Bacteroidales bacterium]